jgi:uncharacterized protein GlcG (DUF336 family)
LLAFIKAHLCHRRLSHLTPSAGHAGAGGDGLRLLRLTGAIPIDGGAPIIVDGIIGALGVSGGSGEQDGLVAKAGSSAAK